MRFRSTTLPNTWILSLRSPAIYWTAALIHLFVIYLRRQDHLNKKSLIFSISPRLSLTPLRPLSLLNLYQKPYPEAFCCIGPILPTWLLWKGAERWKIYEKRSSDMLPQPQRPVIRAMQKLTRLYYQSDRSMPALLKLAAFLFISQGRWWMMWTFSWASSIRG